MRKKNVLPALVFIAVAATAFKITDDIIHRLGMEQRHSSECYRTGYAHFYL